eukprot:SAG11_NODE_4041_length_2092_cov_2.353738_1_plen_270_part_00
MLFSRHTQGTLIVLGGVAWFTPDSMTVKLVDDPDGYTTVFWRGCVFYTAVTLAILIARNMRGGETCAFAPSGHGFAGACGALVTNLRATGWIGACLGFTQPALEACFCLAQKNTSTANVLVLLSTSPLWSALLSRLVLKERIPNRTIVAIVLGVGAIFYVFAMSVRDDDSAAAAGSETDGDATGSNIAGMLLALATAFFLAAQLVLLRLGGNVNPAAAKDDMYYTVCLPMGTLLSAPLLLALGAEIGGLHACVSVLECDLLWVAVGGKA